MPHFKHLVETGDYLGGHGFTACHFYLPEELRLEFNRRRATDFGAGGSGGYQHPTYQAAEPASEG